MACPNRRLAALRRAIVSPATGYGLSRTEVADAVNAWGRENGLALAMTGHYLGKLERGVVRWPHTEYRSALRAVLGVPTDAELGFIPSNSADDDLSIATEPRAPEPSAQEEDDMKRRSLVVTAAGAGLASFVPASTTRIGSRDVQEFASQVDEYVLTEQKTGGGALATAARWDLDRIMAMAAKWDFDTKAATEFLSAAGNMAVTVGWLFHDSADHARAAEGYRDALALAAQAGDDELAAHTCLNSALHTVTQARNGRAHPRNALLQADRAADLSRRQPAGRIHALIACRRALAQACLGDRHAFERTIATAWREMEAAHDYEPLEQCPTWLHFVCHNEVLAHQAEGYYYLGEYSRAADLFGQIARDRAGKRNAANYQAWFAASLAQVGDTSTATAEATNVLHDLADGVSSDRTLRVLQPVRATATATHHADFRDKFDQLARA